MITPRFELSQTENTLTLKIRAPYCSLRDLQLEVFDEVFLFLCKPYYLRLNLPGKIIDNENSQSSYDSDKGEFTFTYEKELKGEHFEDLDFITKFLVNKVEAKDDKSGRKIIMLSNENKERKEETEEGFGFAMRGNKNFITVSSEFADIFEVDPGDVKIKERRKLRLQYEQGKFNHRHYIADLVEDEEILEVIQQESPWKKIVTASLKFTEKELDFLKDLPNYNYDLTEKEMIGAFNGLIDILYAYCYDRRTTNFEGNSESGWTIVKLASTLSWVDAFETPKETLISAFRRSVIYPLYRNFKLSTQVLQDLKLLLSLDEKFIVKCLIDIHQIFLGGDCCRYILNNLFIKDYIIYVMKWDKVKWGKYLEKFNDVTIKKEELGLNLNEIERGFTLEEKLFHLKITEESDSDDSSDESSDSSDDDDDSDSSEEPEEDIVDHNKKIFKFLC